MNKQNETMKDILTTRLDSSDSSGANASNITTSFKQEDPEDIEIIYIIMNGLFVGRIVMSILSPITLTYFSFPEVFVKVNSAPSLLTSNPAPGNSSFLKFPFSAAISSPKNSPMS